MANQSKLKAWVRYDGTGRVISGGPIFQVNKPKVGNWKQIDANLCCNGGSTTTTTTTSGGGGGTPTAWIAYAASYTEAACGQFMGMQVLVYTATSTINPYVTSFYSDASLTQPYSTFTGSYLNINGTVYQVNMSALVIGVQSCTSTTTTTTTQGLFTINAYYQGGSSTDQLCPSGSTGSGPATIYSNTEIIQAGSMLYSSPGNPLTFGGFFYKQVGQNGVFYAPADNGVAAQYNCPLNGVGYAPLGMAPGDACGRSDFNNVQGNGPTFSTSTAFTCSGFNAVAGGTGVYLAYGGQYVQVNMNVDGPGATVTGPFLNC